MLKLFKKNDKKNKNLNMKKKTTKKIKFKLKILRLQKSLKNQLKKLN